MLYRLIPILVAVTFGQSVQAGPWLREKGSTFNAVSFSSSYYLETASQIYLEYGLTETTTLIGDLSMARSQVLPAKGTATVSIRRALVGPEAKSKWAYELGVGVGWIGEQVLPHVRTALSWGKGITWAEKSGWMTLDAAVLWDTTQSLHVGKVDTTLGMKLTDVTTGMLQFYSVFAAGDQFFTIAPSLVFQPKNAKFRLQVSSESEIGNLGNTALKIGLWREF